MKLVLKLLAFCAAGYIWLAVLFGYYMGTAQSETLPARTIAIGAYASLLTLCCFLSLPFPFWAAVVSWLGALTYITISWRVNVGWVFRAQLTYCLWVPLLLSLNAYFERRREIEREGENH